MFSGAVHIKYKVFKCIKGYISANVKQYKSNSYRESTFDFGSGLGYD